MVLSLDVKKTLAVFPSSDRLNWIDPGKECIVSGIRIGVQLASLQLPFKQALLTAANLGVHGVEIDARTDLRPSELSGTALRQVKKLLNDLDLRVVSIRFRTRRGYDSLEELDRRVSATKEAMKMAFDLGAQLSSIRWV